MGSDRGDIHGNGYVSDHIGNAIYKVFGDNVTLFAGGLDSNAEFDGPSGLTVDFQGNVYVADQFNYRIQKIDPMGNVSTFFDTDLEGPTDLVFGSNGKLYVADGTRILEIDGGTSTPMASTQDSVNR